MGPRAWFWTLFKRHIRGFRSRPAVRWMNVFAVLSVLVAVFAWTAVVSIMTGLQDRIRERVFAEQAHLLWEGKPQVLRAEQRQSLEKGLASSGATVSYLLETEGLVEVPTNASGRIQGSGALLLGVRDLERGARVSYAFADFHDLQEGSTLLLRSPWRLEGMPLEIEVSEMVFTRNSRDNRYTVELPVQELQAWLNIPDAISKIEIQIPDPTNADDYLAGLRASGLEFKSWKTLNASLWYSLKLEKVVMVLSMFFVVLLATFAVYMALSVRVAEKSREIALLRALGAQSSPLVKLYFYEGSVLAVIGAVLGLALSWFFCTLILQQGWLQLSSAFVSTAIAVNWNWGLNLGLGLVVLLLAVLASWFPARSIVRAKIIEALRA